MPTTALINTQQILQMGTHAEKLQHTMQHLRSITVQQMQDEQEAINELKHVEIQDPEKIEASCSINPEGKRRREIRLRNKSKQDNDIDTPISISSQKNIFNDVLHQGQKINLTV